MTKAIVLSINPEHACNILNGLKTYEARKRPLKTGDIVYGYVTKGKPYLYNVDGVYIYDGVDEGSFGNTLNGTVPFRFVVGKILTFRHLYHGGYMYMNSRDYVGTTYNNILER